MNIESTGGLVAKIGTKEILLISNVVISILVLGLIHHKKKADKLEKENIEIKAKEKGGN